MSLPSLVYNWRTMVLRGIITVALGLLVLIQFSARLGSIGLPIACFLIIDGLFCMIAAHKNERNAHRYVVLMEGSAGIVIGLLLISRVEYFQASLSGLVACWAMIRGIAELVAASQITEQISAGWLLFFAGFITFATGLLLALSVLAVTPLAVTISYFGFVVGGLFLLFSYQLYKRDKNETL